MAPYVGLKGSKLQAAIWAECCVAVAIFGYCTASAGGVLASESFRKQFPTIDVEDAAESDKHYRSLIQGTVVATYTLLGAFGSLACAFLGDILGRRLTIFIAAGVQLIGAILMGTSYSLAQFIVGRIFIGLGTGGITATVPAWQSELSKTGSRGSHVSSFGIYCGSGLSLALWVAFGMSFTSGSVAWRFTLAFSGVLSIIVMTFIFTLPESPRWLKMKNRDDEARQILERLYPDDQETVEIEIQNIEVALRMSQNQAGLSSMFTMGPQRIFHRVVLASVTQIMLQMTGVNAIAYYATTIYTSSLHFPAVEASALAAASQACIILGGIICSVTVDRYGRRRLMIVSAAAMSLCFACVTALVSQSENGAASKAAVFFLFLYYVVYTIGFMGIPFLYASEIAPVQLRAAVCGLSTAISWLFNFLVAEVTPVGFSDIGFHYFIVYTITCACCVPIVYFFYPETAGKSLEEVDAIFTESKSIFEPVQMAKRSLKLIPQASDGPWKEGQATEYIEAVKDGVA